MWPENYQPGELYIEVKNIGRKWWQFWKRKSFFRPLKIGTITVEDGRIITRE